MNLHKIRKEALERDVEELRKRIVSLEESSLKKDNIIKKASLLANIVESSSDAIIGLTVSGSIISWNKGAQKIFGYTPPEVYGQNVSMLVPVGQREELRTKQKKVLSGQRVDHIEAVYLRKDGTPFPALLAISPILNSTRTVVGVSVTLRDMTMARKAEEDLHLINLRLAAFLKLHEMRDAPPDKIIDFVVEACQEISDSRLVFLGLVSEDETVMNTHLWSEKAMGQCAVDGKPTEFDIGKAGLWAEAVRQRKAIIVNDYAGDNPCKKGYPEGHLAITRFMGVPLVDKDRVVLVAGFANRDTPYDDSDVTHITLMLEGMWNFMQHRRTEAALLEERGKLAILTENAPFGMAMIEKDGVFSYLNPRVTEILGYQISDVPTGRDWFRKVYPDEDCRTLAMSSWIEDLAATRAGQRRSRVFTATCKDGTRKIVNMIPLLLENGTSMITIEDITESKHAVETSREMGARYATLFESANDAILIMAEDRFVDCNRRALEMFRCQKEEIVGKTPHDFSPPTQPDGKDSAVESLEIIRRVFAGEPQSLEWKHKRLDGTVFDAEVNLNMVILQGVAHIQAIIRDITERKEAMQKLAQAEEKYRSIFENAIEGIYQTSPEGRYLSANPAHARMLGYSSPEELMTEITEIGVQAYAYPDDRVRFKRLMDEHGVARQFEFTALKKDGGRIWVSNNARVVKDGSGRILYYEGTTEDITRVKKNEEDLKASAQKLRKSLSGTIEVISMMLEARDPYTAGHQRRVARLARSIAQEMGLSGDVVDSIRMAGNIHDIGKMSVPAEILAKPARLTDVEMALMKEHPQTGYDILKVADLPRPIADIVLQHHEKLDGSGYPRGLKSEHILLEAQILSVADIVEAMASHRPYRAALGISAALTLIHF